MDLTAECLVHVVVSGPQGSNVVIPLQVQLDGLDDWFMVNISCPLKKRRSEDLLIPTGEWTQLTNTRSSLEHKAKRRRCALTYDVRKGRNEASPFQRCLKSVAQTKICDWNVATDGFLVRPATNWDAATMLRTRRATTNSTVGTPGGEVQRIKPLNMF